MSPPRLGAIAISAISSFFSVIFRVRREYRATPLFSGTHPEHFLSPFVFKHSSRPLFIFNIFWDQAFLTGLSTENMEINYYVSIT